MNIKQPTKAVRTQTPKRAATNVFLHFVGSHILREPLRVPALVNNLPHRLSPAFCSSLAFRNLETPLRRYTQDASKIARLGHGASASVKARGLSRRIAHTSFNPHRSSSSSPRFGRLGTSLPWRQLMHGSRTKRGLHGAQP